MKHLLVVALTFSIPASSAAIAQDVFIFGEIHDNPHHHEVQAERVRDLQPRAIVFEMLTPEQAAKVTPGLLLDRAAIEDALGWSDSGWPDFAMYYPIFTASEAQVFGAAVPRDAARAAMSEGVASAFGEAAERFGLSNALPEDQQSKREALQDAAHCDALPDDMLAPMVEIQRLRDAVIARETLAALDATGGPVAVITGNGHARKDWGVPAAIAQAAPELDVFVLGQTEDDAPLDGGFDEVVSSPAHPRPDPCLAFQ